MENITSKYGVNDEVFIIVRTDLENIIKGIVQEYIEIQNFFLRFKLNKSDIVKE